MAELGRVTGPKVLSYGMTNTPKPNSPPLFTPSTLPELAAPDPVVAFIEDALLAIANRRDEPEIPAPFDIVQGQKGPAVENVTKLGS